VQWHFAMPALVTLLQALPGRLFGGEALPAGVARDWARWGRRPTFVDGAGALPPDRRYAGPLLAVAVPGDPYAPETGVRWLPTLYPGARSRVHVLDPRHRGLGHFGVFRSGATPLWAEAWTWLRASATARQPVDEPDRTRR
jgi:predicted alpha/beta hydrolase